MVRAKPILATLMLALFVLATSDPLLESLGLIHQEAAQTASSDHPLTNGTCWIHLTRHETQPPLAGGPLDFVDHFADAIVELQLADAASPSAAEIAGVPPELAPSWRFSFRAALPARAPAAVS